MSDSQEVKHIFSDWILEVKKDLKKRGSFWTPTLVTSPVRARTVVLRSLESCNQELTEQPRFIIHTDIRSQKWQELKENPEGCLHFYCPKRKWQMIVNFKATLSHRDSDATIEWKRLSENSQRIYSLPNPPGIDIVDPELAYTFGTTEAGYENFGVLTLLPTTFESLQLERPNGRPHHTRAQWNLQTITFKYLAP